MRTNNIKVTLEYKIPYNIPDLNGNIYTKEAIQTAIYNCKENLENGAKLPIMYLDNSINTEPQIIGMIEHLWNIQNNEIEQYYEIDAKGILWFGGSEEKITGLEENNMVCKGTKDEPAIKFIKDFKFVSFGISNFK